jgi:hypothetical protein
LESTHTKELKVYDVRYFSVVASTGLIDSCASYFSNILFLPTIIVEKRGKKIMNEKIAWVTDSSVCLSKEMMEHPDIFIVPVTIFMDDIEYRDGIDITPIELFEKLKTISFPPKTSQPSVGTFIQLPKTSKTI